MFNFTTIFLLISLACCFGISQTSEVRLTVRNLPAVQILQPWMDNIEWQITHEHEIQDYMKSLSAVALEQRLIYDAKEQHQVSNESDCISSLIRLGVDLASKKKIYAIKAIDSVGKPAPGIMLGNIRWSGRYYECQNIKVDNFKGKWCEAKIGPQFQIKNQGVSIGLEEGLCVPDSCSSEYLTDRLQDLIGNNTAKISVHCPVQPTDWNAADIVSLFVFCMLLSLVVIGTILEILVNCKKNKHGNSLSINGDTISSSCNNPSENHPVWMKVFLCFSIIKNTEILLNTDKRAGQIDCLHGIRFLSISWVVLGHSYVMVLSYIENSIDLFNWMSSSFTFQTVVNATYSVDSFFLLGGLLVTYLTLKEVEKGKLNVPMMYLQRYMRITPAYAFVILFTVGFFGKLGDGPMWPDFYEGRKSTCVEYWWANLLYINNIHPTSVVDQCFSVGWYLANDMQFFLLAPISIFLLNWKPNIGINILVFGIISNLIVVGVISAHYNEQPQPVAVAQFIQAFEKKSGSFLNNTLKSQNNVGTPPLNPTDAFWSDLYFKPWCRIGVYLIGMITGYILHVTKCKIKMTKLFAVFGWTVAASLNLALLYGLWYYVNSRQPMEVSLAAFYNTMSRPMWAIGIAWMVVACASGYGGPVNTFLSWKLFIPLSRLTYCIFLVHITVIFWWFPTLEDTVYYSNKQFAFFYISILMSSIAAAYVLAMLVESPVMRLQKLMFEHRKTKPIITEAAEDPLLASSSDSGE